MEELLCVLVKDAIEVHTLQDGYKLLKLSFDLQEWYQCSVRPKKQDLYTKDSPLRNKNECLTILTFAKTFMSYRYFLHFWVNPFTSAHIFVYHKAAIQNTSTYIVCKQQRIVIQHIILLPIMHHYCCKKLLDTYWFCCKRLLDTLVLQFVLQ